MYRFTKDLELHCQTLTGNETAYFSMTYVSAPSWTRTMNLLIKSQLLCQLS